MNENRIERAQIAVDAYKNKTCGAVAEVSSDELMTDLMVDMYHLAKSNGDDFEHMFQIAKMHAEFEAADTVLD